MSYSDEVRWHFQWWADVFNPVGYAELIADPSKERMAEQARHFAVKSALFGTAAAGVWALSGGGASMGMWFGASPPTAKRMFMLKVDTYRQMMEGVRYAAPHLARAAPYAAGAALLGGTAHAMETGDTSYTIQHQVMMPFISNWLSGLGQNDTRGGREYSLF